MAKLQADLREFIVLLNSHNVEYLVVGGHAVAFHGHPRFTGDIDFFVRANAQNAKRILDVLEAFGFGGIGISESDLVERGRVISLGQPPNRIDVLTSISGVDFDAAWESRVETVLDDQPVAILATRRRIASTGDLDAQAGRSDAPDPGAAGRGAAYGRSPIGF